MNDPRDYEAFRLIYYDLDEDISYNECLAIYHLIENEPDMDIFDHLDYYANVFINSYLSHLRIKKAKELMYETKHMVIDDIIDNIQDLPCLLVQDVGQQSAEESCVHSAQH